MEPASPFPLPFLRNGVTQLGFVVKDIDAVAEMYWKMFGIGPWHFYTYGAPLVKKMTIKGKPGEYRMRLALANAGPTRMELIEMVEGDTVYKDFVEEHGYGLQHLGLLVEDMDAALAQVRAAGIDVVMEGEGFGLEGDGRYAYIDTVAQLGIMLELIQRPRDRVTPEKIYPPPAEDAPG
jgi:4-hydroxyphenylpyruvate dioxygenase-like putative hemolysin